VRGDGLDIDWKTAPRVGARKRLSLKGDARVVAWAGDDPLVVVGPRGVTIAADPARNPALVRWGYWPWLLHVAAERAQGRDPGRFADWPGAPLVHRRWALGFAALLALLVALAATGFAWARRRARAEPDAHVRFFAALQQKAAPEWSRPGMARPLGGFLFFLSATVLALGPWLYLTAVVWPRWVQPFPEVDGAWGPVDEVCVLAWIVVDFGISTAFVQRFAQRRAGHPARALKAAQLYVWWEIAGGLILFAAGGGAACGILPHTPYALFSRVLLLRALLQVPGVLSLFGNFFQATQRFDRQLGIDFLQNRILIVVVPIGTVLLGRWLGRHSSFGESWGAIAGLALGQYVALASTCAAGFVLFRRMGLPLGPLFHAGFDGETARDLLSFGSGIVAGKAPYFLANALELFLLTSLLPGYPAWLGIRQLLNSRFVFVLYFAFPFLDSGMPAFAEALAAHKHQLARYYVVRYLQWGHWFVAVVIAFLIGAGRPLALHALSAEWRPAAEYLPLAAAIGLLLPSAWLADSFQNGAGRAGLNATVLFLQQGLRVGLLWLLVPRLGFSGIFVALGLTWALKSGLGWWINHKLLLPLRFHPWTQIGAPLTAGGAFYALIAVAQQLMPPLPLFVAAALAAFPLGLFLLGLAGGLDGAALDELERAAELTSFMRPVARLLSRAARAGARLAPRPPPPLALASDAERETGS
jgi:O-antigen/teichoic acid export membrane protein